MRLGYALPNIGALSTPENIIATARGLEAMGWDSAWVTERLLFPLQPRSKYPGTRDGALPDAYHRSLDPLETLTFVAAVTSRLRLGTSILAIPFYNPAVLARRLATLDVLSGGRVHAGLGLGWSEDEYEAVGRPSRGRGRRATEFINVMKAIWNGDPVRFKGEFFSLPPSTIQPKPVQQPLPVTLAAFSPAGLKRAATIADGWHPTALPAPLMRRMLDQLLGFAREAGRDRDRLQVVVRANMDWTAETAGEKRWLFTGDRDQIRGDIEAMREVGVDELLFDPTFSPDAASIDRYLARAQEALELARRVT